MSGFFKTLVRRVSGNVFGRIRHHHTQPTACNYDCNLAAILKSEQNIGRFVQKTIIPMNMVMPKASILDMPCTNIIDKVDLDLFEKIDVEPTKRIIDPNRNEEKHAHRMLIIKRKKMNRHKYKKRQRKLKHYFAKIKRERRMRKEVAFRQEIVTKLKEAQKFNAEAYVAEKLEIYRKNILPGRLHGKRMPLDIITDWHEKKKFKKLCIQEIKDRRKRFIAERGSLDVDWKQ